MLKLENVSLIYDIKKETKTFALKNINLKLEDKKFYGILGPSGSGKSSLLYILSALKKPNQGSVSYNDKMINNISSTQLEKIRKKEFGFVFQKHFLISYLNVLQNVLVPVNSNDKKYIEKAMDLLRSLEMDKYINKKPYQLSGGQCQRVAIARALINDPKVIFADEITASLDHKSAEKAMEVIGRFKDKATIIVVTHDPSILKKADEIINIWDGEISDGVKEGE